MAGIDPAVRDPRWGIDLMTIRLTEATVAGDTAPPLDAPVDVTTRLLGVVDLGTLGGLRLEVKITTGGSGEVACLGTFTIAGQGPGLAGADRPPPPQPAPSARRAVAGGAESWRREVAVAAEAVERFARWSGDETPFHHDRGAAQVAGLPEPIAPGIWVLAVLAASAAEATGSAVAAAGARFVKPTFVGDRLLVDVHHDPARPGEALAVSAEGSHGAVVRRGWVRLA